VSYGVTFHAPRSRPPLRIISPAAESVYIGGKPLIAMWEITITCHDDTRLRLSDWTDAAPHKGEVVETVDTGSDYRRLSRREAAWLAPSLFPGQGDGNVKSPGATPRRFPPPWTVEDKLPENAHFL
jgi:hypothetical protein